MQKGRTSKTNPEQNLLSVNVMYFKSHDVENNMSQSELILNKSEDPFLIPAGWCTPIVPDAHETEGLLEARVTAHTGNIAKFYL